MEKGVSMQQAIDKIGDMIDDCYKCWYKALGDMRSFGEDVDREMLRFVDVCRLVALGNLHWR